jgi:predicted permease
MSWITNWLLRARALWRRRELDADLDAELAHHLEMKQHRFEQQGAAGLEARDAARRSFGNLTRWKETTRELWGFPYWEGLWSDTAYAVRLLRKDRVFTFVALLTLALGIGANTAIFSLLNGLLWRPLPVERPDELVRISLTNLPPTERQWTDGRQVAPTERRSLTYAMYEALGKHQQVFSGMFARAGGGSMHLELNGVPRRADVTTVTGSFFPVLGLRAQIGRLLNEADDIPGGPVAGWAVVISDAMWTRMFGRSPSVVGAAVTIELVPFTVAGVAPPSFHGTNPGIEPEVYMPISAMEVVFSNWRWRTDRRTSMMLTLARLKKGVTIEQARQHLAAIAPAVLEEARDPALDSEAARHFLAMNFEPLPASAGEPWTAIRYGESLWILLAAVSAVLLIAVTNLTNLFLARSTARSREIAVRLALGAPASRIRRQLLLESTLLAAGGTAAALLWANWLVRAAEAAVSRQGSAIRVNTSLDARLFAFLAVVLLAVVLIAGLAPAVSASRVRLQQVLKGQKAALRSWGARRALIVLQTALSLTLLAGAGLMMSSLQRLLAEPTGFATEDLLLATPDLLNAGISRERLPQAYRNLLSEARALPNVVAAAWTGVVPLTGGLQSATVEVQGRADLDQQQRWVFLHRVSDHYFSAMGIPLLAGSDLPPIESGRVNVCVISDSAAKKFFGSPPQALGQRLKRGDNEWDEVVGVVADAKYQSIREARPPTVYLPNSGGMNLAVRYRGSQQPLIASLQRAFEKEAGRLPFTQIQTLRGNLAESLGAERLLAWLLGGFAVFALLITATGLSGLLSYAVEQRRKELGIRMALGATPARIRRDIQWQGLGLTFAGLVAGAGLSYALRRSLDAYLFGVGSADLVVWAAGVGVLLAAALAATAMPARRAVRINPVAMLREE